MPSDPTTWTELKATLANWLARDDLTAEIPEAIALAERRFQRTVFAPEREIVADLVLNAEEVSLPADLWGIRAIHISSSDPRIVLEPMTLAELRNAYAANTTGRPQNYAIRGEKLILGPAPDASYTAKLSYIQTIPALGSGQATNWLLTDHPDLYLYGALHALHLLLADEARATFFDARFREAAEEVNRSALRRTSGGAPLRIRAPIRV